MGKERRFSRLGSKLLGASLLGLGLAYGMYALVTGMAVPWLLYSQYFTSLWQTRQEASLQAYQAYVQENGLSVQQVLEDHSWDVADPATTVYTVVVGSEIPPLEDFEQLEALSEPATSIEIGYTAVLPMVGSPSTTLFVSNLRAIQCADGEIYLSAAPNTAWLEGLGRIVGIVLALAAFCGVVAPCIFRLLRRIEALSRETGLLMAGDLSHSIRAPGRDELSRLGEDIERLRLSVVERIEGEREAVGATSRLITGLSHDLRTPLTKLMGYLEILSRCQSQEERDRYVRMAAEKAEQIKGMTDLLFDRAQVAGRPETLAGPPELVDGAQLLGQVLSELCCDLQREGFNVLPPIFAESFQLYVRTEDTVRVFDNLFSNLRKYADPVYPVRFSVELGPGTVRVAAENHVRTDPDRQDSHGVGLPTMEELLERSGGRLETGWEGAVFHTALTFVRR